MRELWELRRSVIKEAGVYAAMYLAELEELTIEGQCEEDYFVARTQMEWAQAFPSEISPYKIKKAFKSLEEAGLIIPQQKRISRGNSHVNVVAYKVDFKAIEQLEESYLIYLAQIEKEISEQEDF